jgi:hypothetical protein
MNTATCNCHPQASKVGLNERPRYYARQLVTPDDLTLEQNYFRARLRRHNRYLHGWGVVCGAEVVESTRRDTKGVQIQPWKVIVKTGYVLGPYGDEIYIESDQCVDVRKKCGPEETPDDAECLDQRPDPPRDDDAQRWIAIRYVENKTRLIRVPLGGCGCEDNACEYSRFADDYEICVIDHCPESHKNPPESPIPGRGPDPNEKATPDCPECESEPWVVLSAFKVDKDGKVTLQQCDCRRQVLSFGDFWWSCGRDNRVQPGNLIPKETPARPGTAPTEPANPTPASPTPATPTRPTPVTPTPPTPTPPTPTPSGKP